jgi:membrane protein DedA with SNARE-associated domain
MWPYYYAAMSTAVWTVLFVTVGASMVMRISHRSLRQAVRGAFALLAALMAIAIGASNREAISLLQRHTLTHAAEFREWLDRTPK